MPVTWGSQASTGVRRFNRLGFRSAATEFARLSGGASSGRGHVFRAGEAGMPAAKTRPFSAHVPLETRLAVAIPILTAEITAPIRHLAMFQGKLGR